MENVTLEDVLDGGGGKHIFAGGGASSIVLKGNTELKNTIDIIAKSPIQIRAENESKAKVTGKVVVKTAEAVTIAAPVENEIEIRTENQEINIKAKVNKVVALADVIVKVDENVTERPELKKAKGVKASAKVVDSKGKAIAEQPEGYDFIEDEDLEPVEPISKYTLNAKLDRAEYTVDEDISISGAVLEGEIGLADVDITLKLTDDKEQIVSVEQIKTNAEGEFTHTFKVPEGTEAGTYILTVKANEPVNESREEKIIIVNKQI